MPVQPTARPRPPLLHASRGWRARGARRPGGPAPDLAARPQAPRAVSTYYPTTRARVFLEKSIRKTGKY